MLPIDAPGAPLAPMRLGSLAAPPAAQPQRELPTVRHA
jgi:hypothetical protein